MEPARTIIICLATSPYGVVVAREGLRFAGLLNAKAIFLNVGEDTKERREALTSIIQGDGSIPADQSNLLIRPGDPYSTIIAAASETRAEMVIMGALNRDPAWVRVWGSVARKIARRAPCSVLLLSSTATQRAGDRIVAGIGFDNKPSEMMSRILQIAREGKSESIHFVLEFSQKSTSLDAYAAPTRMNEEERALEQQRSELRLLADFLSAYDLTGLNVRMAALPGREGMQVVDYARRQHADLIILPAPPGRLTIWDRFFRHPLESVLIELPCALLLQRPSTRKQTE